MRSPLFKKAYAMVAAGDMESALFLRDSLAFSAPDDPELGLLDARIALGQQDVRKALAALDALSALDALPSETAFGADVVRAEALMRLGKVAEAAATAQEAVKRLGVLPTIAPAEAATAYIQLALAAEASGQGAPALAAAQAAVGQDPGEVTYNLLARVLRRLGRLSDAADAWRKALEYVPYSFNALHGLARDALARQDDPTAKELLTRAMETPGVAHLVRARLAVMLSKVHQRRAEAQEAYAVCQRLLDSLPPLAVDARALLFTRLGRLAMAGQDFHTALKWARQARDANPQREDVAWEVVYLLFSLDSRDEALAMATRHAEAAPGNPAIWSRLAGLRVQAGALDEAEEAIASALAVDPAYLDALLAQGMLCHRRGDYLGSLLAFEAVLKQEPENRTALVNSMTLYRMGRQYPAALALCERLSKLGESGSLFLNAYGILLLELLHIPESLQMFIASIRATGAVKSDSGTPLSNLCMALHYDMDVTVEELAEVHQVLAQAFDCGEPDRDKPHPRPDDPEKRLKIGYLSSDFRRHSVAYFFEAVLRAHDRTQVEVILYSTTTRPDAVTEMLGGLADGVVNAAVMSDRELADRIWQDGTDVLIDLNGHTDGGRPAVWARKPAPIQVTWLGYPDTTGLPTVDARIVDSVTDPMDASDWCAERRLRLDPCFLAFQPPAVAPEVGPAPCLTAGHVTFGSFNSLHKITPRVLEQWCRILHAVPESRLLVKAKQFGFAFGRDRFLESITAQGIARERVELIGYADDLADHLGLYGRMDLALDTFPYNGTTTTCEAMWMGVPVLTVQGTFHAARVGMSLLRAVGLNDDMVARDIDDYVGRAVALARDPERLAGLRRNLRPRMAASPLCDGPGLARRLEDAYRTLWAEYCKRGDQTCARRVAQAAAPDAQITGSSGVSGHGGQAN